MISRDFWKLQQSQILLNPRLPMEEKAAIEKAIQSHPQPSTLWLRSSGTESNSDGIKMVALRFSAFLTAAQSVNHFYNVTEKDIWLNPLPLFHVGGLAISARCFLSNAKEIVLPKWSPEDFYELCTTHKVTLTSLVPTQVFDLLNLNKPAPPSLRLVIVGGGELSQELFQKGKKGGWNLVPSYGMTETSALVAGSSLDDLNSLERPPLRLLPHVKIFKRGEKIGLQSETLFTGYLWVFLENPPVWQDRPNPFLIDDRIKMSHKTITILGRESELIKILGETVNLNELRKKLNRILSCETLIIPQPEPRRGFSLHLYIEDSNRRFDLEPINQQLLPYERIFKIHILKKFPRTELGKIKISDLKFQG